MTFGRKPKIAKAPVIVKKPVTKPDDNREKWRALAPFVKKHFKTDMTVKEIAAELSYQEYLKGTKK